MLRAAPLPLVVGHRPYKKQFSPRLRFCMANKLSEATSKIAPTFIPIDAEEGILGKSSKEGLGFRLVSYNILAQVYVKSSYFPHSPSSCLRWKARSQAVLNLLRSFKADFLCLQELDEFDSFYRKNMESEGYSSIYAKRTGLKQDGCGIFYKPENAELILKETIEYNDLVNLLRDSNDSSCEGQAEDANDLQKMDEKLTLEENSDDNHSDRNPNDPRVRLKRDCVGIMAAFRLNDPSHHYVIVVNTHIYWDPEWADVKLAQTKYLLSRLSKFRSQIIGKFNSVPSVIVAGDFNSTPGDDVYRCVVSKNVGEGELPVQLCSLYASAGGEPAFTNCTPGFTGTIDYIFFSGLLSPVTLLQVPTVESPDIVGGLPNSYHPSDHLPIGGDFVLTDYL
ncbi:carbon catabolite repressor protein 4 homolog 4-like isoform X2 [Wolffia australiana]